MKKLLSLLVSVAILVALYASLDLDRLRDAVLSADPAMLAWSLVLLVVLTLFSAVKLYVLARVAGFELRRGESVAAVFTANAINLVVPGRLGDLLKAAMMSRGSRAEFPAAFGLCVWDKAVDLAVLLALGAAAVWTAGGGAVAVVLATLAVALFAIVMVPVRTRWCARARRLPWAALGRAAGRTCRSWYRLVSRLLSRRRGVAAYLALSVLLWGGQLAQIALMLSALGVAGGALFWLGLIGLLPIAMLAGLVPLTHAGLGTRDAALVFVLSPIIGAESAAALGLLFLLRYLVPGLLGLPLIPRFWGRLTSLAIQRAAAS